MTARAVSLAALLLALPLAGCHVDEHKDANGDTKNVDISTPFGGMHVNTNKDGSALAGLGLSVYPGATPVHENGDHNSAADVNMSFGDFHLGVKAAGYQTSDSPDKVEAFYRKDMAKYGAVLKCHGSTAVGTPDRTAEGLTCRDNDSKHGSHISYNSGDDSNDHDELRAGSPSHQHIVGIEPKDGGTKIGLVLLDLPKDLKHHDDKQSE